MTGEQQLDKAINGISENSYVRLGLVLLMVAGAARGAVWMDRTAHATQTNAAATKEIAESVEELTTLVKDEVIPKVRKIEGKSPNGWHREPQQTTWCNSAERQNEGWKCPDPMLVPWKDSSGLLRPGPGDLRRHSP